jgi:hypothetical protein
MFGVFDGMTGRLPTSRERVLSKKSSPTMSRRGILLFVTLLLSHSIAVNVDSMIQSMTLRQKIGQLITVRRLHSLIFTLEYYLTHQQLEFAQVQSGSSYSAAKNVLVEQGFGVGSSNTSASRNTSVVSYRYSLSRISI